MMLLVPSNRLYLPVRRGREAYSPRSRSTTFGVRVFSGIPEAVNLRNRYVHGSTTRHDYSKDPDLEIFLTDTLEFVFAASDLVDAGWNICDWVKCGPHMHHPFGSYPLNWKKLKHLIDKG